jgi:hypothetical protein
MSEQKTPSVIWKPPERPAWVRQINEEGDCMNISAVVPLNREPRKPAPAGPALPAL